MSQTSNMSYPIKRANNVAVCLQAENGPCPLLALTNALLLSHKLRLPRSEGIVTTDELCRLLSGFALSLRPSEHPEAEAFDMAFQEVIELFPTIEEGLDIDPRFTRVDAMNATKELNLFDLFRVPIYHGWVVEPTHKAYDILKPMSYNTVQNLLLQALVIADKPVVSEEEYQMLSNAQKAQIFLDESPTQMTMEGLVQLHTEFTQSFGVFFRNNHFSTITKYKNQIYELVTDVGFASSRATWTKLDNIHGDLQFFDAEFHPMHTIIGHSEVNESLYEHHLETHHGRQVSEATLQLIDEMEERERRHVLSPRPLNHRSCEVTLKQMEALEDEELAKVSMESQWSKQIAEDEKLAMDLSQRCETPPTSDKHRSASPHRGRKTATKAKEPKRSDCVVS